MTRDLTVLIPTFNRAESLRRTLLGMAVADREGIDVEIVVIDNNSTDETRELVAKMQGLAPIRYLFEPEPGKNHALNRGLEEADLGELVVFTDDDVDVSPSWFRRIVEVSARWPSHDVFGGHIYVVWPAGQIPRWADDSYIRGFAFTEHDYAAEERTYDERRVPFGPNFWVRRSVFADGLRFATEVGPHPTNRILGDETQFLRGLRAAGHEPVYSPLPSVGHRISKAMLEKRGIRRRAYQLGRGIPHVYGLPRRSLLESRPLLWRVIRVAAVVRDVLGLCRDNLRLSAEQRFYRSIHRIRDLGSDVEALGLASVERCSPDVATAR